MNLLRLLSLVLDTAAAGPVTASAFGPGTIRREGYRQPTLEKVLKSKIFLQGGIDGCKSDVRE